MAERISYQVVYHRRVLAKGVGYRVNRRFLRNCQFDVGAYVEASTDVILINDNYDRTHPCIYLGPSGNRQGSHNCFFF